MSGAPSRFDKGNFRIVVKPISTIISVLVEPTFNGFWELLKWGCLLGRLSEQSSKLPVAIPVHAFSSYLISCGL